MKYSEQYSTQEWLGQFQQEDKVVAARLLDQLIYITTENVVESLAIRLDSLIEANERVAIFPIRELKEEQDKNLSQDDGTIEEETYFNIEDPTIPPALQSETKCLGSEAFISNLITQVSRRHKRRVLSNEGTKELPSLSNIRNFRTNSLILIDDLIGSGTRTLTFLNSFCRHPTIKSWLSGGQVSINVVSFMGTGYGVEKVRRWCKKKKGINLDVLNTCPILDTNDKELMSLCKRYADVREKFPIGFMGLPVAVVFSHSAPNNLPAILYRNKSRLRTQDPFLQKHYTKWSALFPNRSVPEEVKSAFSNSSKRQKINNLIEILLRFVRDADGVLEDDIVDDVFSQGSEKSLLIKKCLKFSWLEKKSGKLYVTQKGLQELTFLSKPSAKRPIANNEKNYYPRAVSRVNDVED